MTKPAHSTKTSAICGAQAANARRASQSGGSKKQMTIGRALVSASSILALSMHAGKAADLATSPPSAPVVLPEVAPHWFVRIGVLGAIERSSSNLYAQTIVGILGVGPQLLLAGRGESFSNLLTVGVQAGYFVTPNWSLEIAGGFPVWQTAKITGYSTTGPAAGTVLTKSLPASLPITAVYHFTQFGRAPALFRRRGRAGLRFAGARRLCRGQYDRAFGRARFAGRFRLHVQSKLGRLY
jgi:outer membrane protein W